MATILPRQHTTSLGGRDTTVLLQSFADRFLVLVTQLGKVGNLIQATLPATVPLLTADSDAGHTLPEPPAAVTLTPLLGSAPSDHIRTLHSLYAAQIATIIWTHEAKMPANEDRRSVVVGIALAKGATEDEGVTPVEQEVFAGVMKTVQELLVQ